MTSNLFETSMCILLKLKAISLLPVKPTPVVKFFRYFPVFGNFHPDVLLIEVILRLVNDNPF